MKTGQHHPGGAWIASDLDGTLFSRDWGGEGAVPGTWRVGSEHQVKEPSSWICSDLHKLFAELSRFARIVPVTARDRTSFGRVSIEGVPFDGPSIIANGGEILEPSGKPDEDWHDSIFHEVNQWKELLVEYCSWLQQASDGVIKSRIVEGAFGLSAFVVGKAPAEWWGGSQGMIILENRQEWNPLQISFVENTLQALPPGVGKRRAVDFLREHYFEGNRPLMCFGDSHQDVPFMEAAAVMATPAGSQIGVSLGRKLS